MQANDKYNQLHAEMQDAKRDGQQAKTAYEDTQRDLQLVQATVKALEEKVDKFYVFDDSRSLTRPRFNGSQILALGKTTN